MEVGRASQRRQYTAQQALALASGLSGASSAAGRAIYNALPTFSERRIVDQAIRSAHEVKNIDVQGLAQVFTNVSAPLTFLLNPTTQGTTGTSRTGRKFKMESLRISALTQSPSNTIQDDVYRFIVFVDKDCRGAAPTVADVLQFTTFGVTEIVSPRNIDNMSRFRVLYDKVQPIHPSIGAPTGVAGSVQIPMISWNVEIPLNTVVRCYNTSVGTIADIETNSVYMMAFAISTTNLSTLNFISRIKFRDL
jgi:hypothetical protein